MKLLFADDDPRLLLLPVPAEKINPADKLRDSTPCHIYIYIFSFLAKRKKGGKRNGSSLYIFLLFSASSRSPKTRPINTSTSRCREDGEARTLLLAIAAAPSSWCAEETLLPPFLLSLSLSVCFSFDCFFFPFVLSRLDAIFSLFSLSSSCMRRRKSAVMHTR